MKIKKGDRIIIDKGICGMDFGTLISTNGFSIGGFYGLYKNDKDEKEHIFDQTVHKIIKLS